MDFTEACDTCVQLWLLWVMLPSVMNVTQAVKREYPVPTVHAVRSSVFSLCFQAMGCPPARAKYQPVKQEDGLVNLRKAYRKSFIQSHSSGSNNAKLVVKHPC